MALRPEARVFTEAEMPQGSEAWRSVRCGCLTGSRCSPIMVEKKPSATRDTLLLELAIEQTTGKSPRVDYQSDAMLQGIEREADARRYHEAETGELVTQVGFVYWVGKKVGFSPDGMIGDWDELVSIKCRELKAHYEHVRRGTIPVDALRQMAHELWVAGPGCRVHNYVSYNPDFVPGLRYRRVALTWEQLNVDAYAARAEAFLWEVETEVAAMKQLATGAPWAAALEEGETIMSDETKRDDELGALWVKEGQKGEFMTGSVICTQCKHKEDIILFKNQFRTKENHPAWRILKSRQQGERHTYAPSTRRDEQPRKTVFAAEEQFDSQRIPQKRWPEKVMASKQDAAKFARDWTDDVPPIAVTDEDIPF